MFYSKLGKPDIYIFGKGRISVVRNTLLPACYRPDAHFTECLLRGSMRPQPVLCKMFCVIIPLLSGL